MSKLDELIAKLCPQGVEYKKLGEIATISRGGNFQKKDYLEQGIPCIHYGQIYTYYGLFVNDVISYISEEVAQGQKMAVTNDVIMAVTSENIDDVCKCIAWLGEDQVAVSGHTAIIHHNQNPKYMIYYLQSSMFFRQKVKLAHGTKVIEVTPNKLASIILPVPPLEVQSEVVRILDHLSECTSELITELTSELTLRKKQYEYYRDFLYVFTDINVKSIEWKSLKDLAINHDAKRKPVSKGNREKGEYPYYGASGIVDYVNDYIFDGDYLLISEDGANLLARSTPIAFSISGKNWVNNHAHVLEFSDYTTRKYVEIYLNSIDLSRYISTAAQPKLTQDNLNKIGIPLPDQEEMERIVSILEKFDTICTDLNTGIPAEIIARQKQYEYYRDKLLTFKELGE